MSQAGREGTGVQLNFFFYFFYFLVFALFIHSFLWLAQPAPGARLAQHVVPGIELWSLLLLLPKLS